MTPVSWVLKKIKKGDSLRYLHFWIRIGPLGMDIVLYNSNLLLLGSYGQKKIGNTTIKNTKILKIATKLTTSKQG